MIDKIKVKGVEYEIGGSGDGVKVESFGIYIDTEQEGTAIVSFNFSVELTNSKKIDFTRGIKIKLYDSYDKMISYITFYIRGENYALEGVCNRYGYNELVSLGGVINGAYIDNYTDGDDYLELSLNLTNDDDLTIFNWIFNEDRISRSEIYYYESTETTPIIYFEQ